MSDLLTAAVLVGVYLLGILVGRFTATRRGLRGGLMDLTGWHDR